MSPLADVLQLLTCATIASCDDFDDIVAWGDHHWDFLRRFSAFHFGILGVRWLQTLVIRINPVPFGRCFERWIAALWPDRHDLIAIDGKTSRCTQRHPRGAQSAPYVKCLHEQGQTGLGTAQRAPMKSPLSPSSLTTWPTPVSSRERWSLSTRLPGRDR